MKTLLIACAMFVASLGLASAAESATVTPEAAAEWLATTPAVQVLDVRTKEEFATGHLARAALIPWTDKDFKSRAAKELDPGKPVLVYCRSGRRSAEASAALAALGFTELRNLKGGILAWQKAGKPITKPE
jgi:rhodanese-related sulfurtransferase